LSGMSPAAFTSGVFEFAVPDAVLAGSVLVDAVPLDPVELEPQATAGIATSATSTAVEAMRRVGMGPLSGRWWVLRGNVCAVGSPAGPTEVNRRQSFCEPRSARSGAP